MPLKSIVVIGDVMLDKFSYGRVKRLNPESPVPLINIEREEYKLGGAANVAANVESLGGNVTLIGRVGSDYHGNIFQELCKKGSIHFETIPSKEVPTTTKERIIETTYQQQLVRKDHEVHLETESSSIEYILSLISTARPDIIIVSDYNKGVITENLAMQLIETGIPVIADIKPGRFQWFRGALVIKPNFKEFVQQLDIEGENTDAFIEKYIGQLCESLETNLVVTRSEYGVSMMERGGIVEHIPSTVTGVFDVTGAGDTFIATMGVAILEGKSLIEAVKLGNKASGIVVKKVGTAVIMREEL